MERKIDYMTEDEILEIPERDLPLAVLSSNATSPFAFGIMVKRKAIWNHFMWMHKPGFLATQDLTYREVPVQNYFGYNKRLKFWRNPNWTDVERHEIRRQIYIWLSKPPLTTFYDWVAIIGQALNLVWIQNPATRICSDYGSFLRESGVDLEYNLKHPAPDQIDDWFNSHSNYQVYGRYAGE
jgi:hypothetical protein